MVSTAPAAVLPSVEQLAALHVLTSRVHAFIQLPDLV